jgi:hypothetical protein
MKIHLSLLAAGAAFALGACQQVRNEEARIETAEALRATAVAEGACVDAATAQTGVAGITVLSAVEADGNAEVLLTVPGAERPWRCVASVEGTVAELALSAPA